MPVAIPVSMQAWIAHVWRPDSLLWTLRNQLFLLLYRSNLQGEGKAIAADAVHPALWQMAARD